MSLIYWFPISPKVRDAITKTGLPTPSEIGIRILTSDDEIAAMNLAKSSLRFTQLLIERSLAGINYSWTDGLVEGEDTKDGALTKTRTPLPPTPNRSGRLMLSYAADPERQPDVVYSKQHPKITQIISAAYNHVNMNPREDVDFSLGAVEVVV